MIIFGIGKQARLEKEISVEVYEKSGDWEKGGFFLVRKKKQASFPYTAVEFYKQQHRIL